MKISEIPDRIKLPFRKDKELYFSLYDIIGFFPRDIDIYKQALLHRSVRKIGEKGRHINNERLEFLGDAILDAAVGDIVYRHFPGKREGFLTNTRAKIVQRSTLNRLAKEMGIIRLVKAATHVSSHNSYMGGNAFEALVGAIYLDRGYNACMRFVEKRILSELINIDKVAYREENFKSKLLEWSQKNRIAIEFKMVSEDRGDQGSPLFTYEIIVEGLKAGSGTGYSKKESQQKASRDTLHLLRHNANFLDAVFAKKSERTQMEEMPVSLAE
ncbi:MAG: ribonuclease III [Prevotella sp.]|nr:ribonuclease III [Prevotella sp.]MBQ8706085.1 ribonuclease III [Paludibacteraceae bacterium]